LPTVFTGAHGEVERFLTELGDHFYVNIVSNDLDKIRIAGMLCDGKAGKWYGIYQLKIDRDMAMRVYGKWVEDPKFMTWDHFEATLRDSHGGRPRHQTDLNKWNALRQTGGIDAFLDEVSRLTWVMDYLEKVVKDKLRDGLKKELRRDWSLQGPSQAGVFGRPNRDDSRPRLRRRGL
jgi:hypothetical protein